MEPWGTPREMGSAVETELFATVCWDLSERYELNQSCIEPLMSNLYNLLSRI